MNHVDLKKKFLWMNHVDLEKISTQVLGHITNKSAMYLILW